MDKVCIPDNYQEKCKNVSDKILPKLTNLLNAENIDNNIGINTVITLGKMGQYAHTSVPQLVELLNSTKNIESQLEIINALGNIASNLSRYSQFSEEKEFRQAVDIINSTSENTNFKKNSQKSKENIENYLEKIQQERTDGVIKFFVSLLNVGGKVIVFHAGCWFVLIIFYPRSRFIQTHVFWSATFRNWLGLGYVNFIITGFPWIRSIMLSPFKDVLVLDANLANFKPEAYFLGSQVKVKDTIDTKPIQEAIPVIRGQVLLEGESGLGKSMFLKHLVQSSRRLVAYLPAKKCDVGVIEAIQNKLHGYVAEDPHFLRSLIYSGAIDICIDGLNEATPDTRANISNFMENFSTGNIILTTQPIEWNPPSTFSSGTYVLCPLESEQIEQFLISRKLVLPQQASITGNSYEQACKNYLVNIFNPKKSEEELENLRHLLSNPMDLTLIAQMLACGKQPDLLNLQQQQYELMAEDYHKSHLKFCRNNLSNAIK